MDELSGDELVVLLISALGALTFTAYWASVLFRHRPLGPRQPGRAGLLLVPVLAVIVFHLVLTRLADREVRDHAIYEALFVLLGLTWMGAGSRVSRLLGISATAELVERSNAAAAPAIGGALLGIAMCFAGANVGGGATIWSTILPAILASATWAALWAGAEVLCGASLAVTVDRDDASGWRLGGALVAAGLVLGRAVAGDYHSAGETLHDFVRQGAFALAPMLAVVVMQWAWRPTPSRPRADVASQGLLPAAALVVAAAAYAAWLGWPEVKS